MRLYLKVATVVCLILALRAPGSAADTPPKVFGGAQVQEVFDRDDLVLEAINTAIKEHNIQDGAVLTGVGSVQACTYHGVQSLAPSAACPGGRTDYILGSILFT